MPVIWDLDEDAIRADEYKATATLAVVAWQRHEPAPMATPLQRAAARAVPRAWCDQQLEAMRARVR
ncbi:MAG TPA: hypothetical protein VIT65_15575 [Microlunatus sp.]